MREPRGRAGRRGQAGERDRRRTRPGTAPARRCPWRGRPSRARAATGGRPALPGPRATRQRRRCAARSGRTGASRGRAAGPRPAAARPAAGGCPATGPAARSCPAGRPARAAARAARRTRRRPRAAPASAGSSWPAVRRAAAYSAVPVRLPAARSSSWRRVISPARASAMRSTRCSSSARFVMTADTCGRAPRPRKVAPPLKSTSTRFRSADECVATRPRTSVLSSSLLPEPVAPTQRPCGPLPPSADSLRSSVTAHSGLVDPDRHVQPVRGVPAAPA